MGLPMLLPEGQGQTVNLWMTGIRMLTGVDSHFADHRQHGHGRFQPVRRALVNEFKILLDNEEQAVANAGDMIVVDARGPPSAKPPWGQRLLGHFGTHPVIMQQVLDSKDFIADIGNQLRAQWPRRPMSKDGLGIGILVFCQSGRHRSVAWTYLIQVMLRSMGYHCKASQAAMNREGACGQCEECSRPISHSIMNQAIVKLSIVEPP
jgi:hypothetical protein